MKATLTNYHQSPQKVRLVANLIRGKSVKDARTALLFLPKKSAPEIGKLLESAVSNARNLGASTEELVIKKISVDKGMVLRRFKAMARGRGVQFRRTMSIINIELGVTPQKVKKSTPKGKPRVKGVAKSE